MPAKNQSQFKKILLLALVFLLFLLVSVQAWYLLKMQKQLDLIRNQQSSIQLQTQTQAQDTTVTKEDVLEVDDNAVAPDTPDEQQSSLQENQEVRPAQRPYKSVMPGHTPNTAFNAPTRDPYAEMQHMQRDMDRRFDRRPKQFNNKPDFQRHFRLSTSIPEIDVKENDHQYLVLVNLPGADKNDISVTLNGQRLTIKGKRNYKKQNRNPTGNIVFQERQSNRFQRSISLSEPVYQNKMKTRLDNGILKIQIPKVPNSRLR